MNTMVKVAFLLDLQMVVIGGTIMPIWSNVGFVDGSILEAIGSTSVAGHEFTVKIGGAEVEWVGTRKDGVTTVYRDTIDVVTPQIG
jgi:hypothetical protein